jgi:hypothetical protein
MLRFSFIVGVIISFSIEKGALKRTNYLGFSKELKLFAAANCIKSSKIVCLNSLLSTIEFSTSIPFTAAHLAKVAGSSTKNPIK